MNLGRLRIFETRKLLVGLMIATALSPWLAAPASAQATVTCNGVPATIVGASPGLITGTAGNDVIVGTTGADQIAGLGGDDIICAGPGDDFLSGGDNNDTLVWNPGDGSDVVEGLAGSDTLVFNGSNAGEHIDLSANGQRLRFFRDVANVVMDVDGVEQVIYNALGGADTITVNDLTGTAAQQIGLNLAGTLNGSAGDSQADSVIVNGTANPDNVTIAGGPGSLALTGLSAGVKINTPEGSLDSLQVNLLGGDDTITTQSTPSNLKVFLSLIRGGSSSSLAQTGPTAHSGSGRQFDAPQSRAKVAAEALPAGVIKLILSGGLGNDTLNGSQGADLLIGGPGNDVANLDAGDDTLVWNPGDGSDVVEGLAGSDTLVFNGSNVGEHIDLSANGQRLRFFRDVANVVMDVDGVEQVTYNALGGADTITVNDLTGTAATTVTLNLAGTLNGATGDSQADSVIVNGTDGNDIATISGAAGSLTVAGLSASVNISAAEAALDNLQIFALGGADAVSAMSLSADVVSLFLDGGAGNDILVGSAGNDQFTGGLDADHFSGGPGTDTVTDFNAAQGDTQDTIP